MSKILIAYVPVLHEGYYQFFKSHRDVNSAYILDRSLIKEFNWLRKELRALDPELVLSAIQAWNIIPNVSLISIEQIPNINAIEIIMPDEDVSQELAQKYFADQRVTFDPIFLRWDRRRSEGKNEINPNHTISEAEFDKRMMVKADDQKATSSNIWRRVGALIIKDGQILGQPSSNRHQPTDHTAWIDGDVRMNYNQGVGIGMSTDMHSEAIQIAKAAREGIKLKGTDIYVTDFPCPPCAMLIANSGIRRCFYAQGYAVLDGERVLKANNVELIKVNVELPPDRADVYRPYPEKT